MRGLPVPTFSLLDRNKTSERYRQPAGNTAATQLIIMFHKDDTTGKLFAEVHERVPEN
jgi:hypothetical protein